MAKSNIPTAISLLQLITEKSQELENYFNTKTPEFKALKNWLKNNVTPDDKDVTQNCIIYFQTLMLVGLSMHKGIFLPDIRTISSTQKKCEIIWQSGIKDQINFGVFDKSLEQFIQTLRSKVFSKDKNDPNSIHSLITDVQRSFDQNNLLLTKVQKQIDKVLNGRNHYELLFNDNLNRQLLFILLACLPADQLNALFLYIQKFFPEELTCKLPEGMTVSVVPFFQKISSDEYYLVQKVIVYFELYTDSKKPIIKHITQSKTKEFLVDLMKNTNTKEKTLEKLVSIKENHVISRKKLYKLFKDHLKEIYK